MTDGPTALWREAVLRALGLLDRPEQAVRAAVIGRGEEQRRAFSTDVARRRPTWMSFRELALRPDQPDPLLPPADRPRAVVLVHGLERLDAPAREAALSRLAGASARPDQGGQRTLLWVEADQAETLLGGADPPWEPALRLPDGVPPEAERAPDPRRRLGPMEFVDELERLLQVQRRLQAAQAPVDTRTAERIDELVRRVEESLPDRAGQVGGALLERVLYRTELDTLWTSRPAAGTRRPLLTKIFLAAGLKDLAALQRFRLSMRVAERLSEAGEGLSQMPEVVEVGEDTLAYTTAAVSGRSLADLAAFHWNLNQKLDCFREVCRAVSALHHRGVGHGGIKPSSVLVTESGSVMLCGLGHAFLLEDSEPLPRDPALHEGNTFAAPEIRLSPELGPPSVRSDVYGLGALLRFLVTEKAPPRQDGLEPLDPPPRLPLRLSETLRVSMAWNPRDRFATVDALLGALDSGMPLGWIRAGLMRRLARPATLLWITLALVVALIATLGWIAGIAIELNGELAKVRAGLDAVLQDDVSRLRGENTALQVQLAELEARARQLQTDVGALAVTTTDQSGEDVRLQHRVSQLLDEQKAKEAELSQLAADLDARGMDLASAQREIERLRQNVVSSQVSAQNLSRQVEEGQERWLDAEWQRVLDDVVAAECSLDRRPDCRTDVIVRMNAFRKLFDRCLLDQNGSALWFSGKNRDPVDGQQVLQLERGWVDFCDPSLKDPN